MFVCTKKQTKKQKTTTKPASLKNKKTCPQLDPPGNLNTTAPF